jgi:hypothetical protein
MLMSVLTFFNEKYLQLRKSSYIFVYETIRNLWNNS